MELELKIVSATDLPKSSLFTQNKPYVIISLSDKSFPSQKTPIDAADGRNPNWNHLVTFSFSDTNPSDLIVKFQIRSGCSLSGEVCVPLLELLNSSPVRKIPAPEKFVSYQVKKPSGRPQGVLTFSYRFTQKFPGEAAANVQLTSPLYPVPEDVYSPLLKPSPEVIRYPAVDVSGNDLYPPPPMVNEIYGHGYPVQGGNGYGYPVKAVNGYPRTWY